MAKSATSSKEALTVHQRTVISSVFHDAMNSLESSSQMELVSVYPSQLGKPMSVPNDFIECHLEDFISNPTLWNDSRQNRLKAVQSWNLGSQIPDDLLSNPLAAWETVSKEASILNQSICLWVITGDLMRTKDYVVVEEANRQSASKKLASELSAFWNEFVPRASQHHRDHMPSVLKDISTRLQAARESGLTTMAMIRLSEHLEAEQWDRLRKDFPELSRLRDELGEKKTLPTCEHIQQIAKKNPSAAAEYVVQIERRFPNVHLAEQIQKTLPPDEATAFGTAIQATYQREEAKSFANPHSIQSF